ncbi:glycosyltransferase [Candidatus Parcubacteria bacterium]|nr:glycosyltransferase [Candidatus Parcubacteria bacterium]
MKKFYYIANIRMPTERAHGIQIMEMCKAFSTLGFDLELIVPNRKTDITDDPFAYYDIDKTFEIKKLWCLDLVKWGRVGFWIQSLTFAKSVLWYVLAKDGIFYTRDEPIAFFLSAFGKRITWEAHMGQKNLFVRTLIKLHTKIVVITDGLKNLYSSLGVRKGELMVAPDGADIDRFDIDVTQNEARKQLNLPLNKKIVLYKGSLSTWKGPGTLAQAARFIQTQDVLVVFIGGKPEDVEAFKKEFKDITNLLILGNRPRKETPVYQKAADVLVIPNSAKEDISKLYTSPMKLFGYMAGGVPIVSSDLPSLREVLSESSAYLCIPDDPQSLAQTIDKVFQEYANAEIKARRALEEVRKYSWKNRAEQIINFIA